MFACGNRLRPLSIVNRVRLVPLHPAHKVRHILSSEQRIFTRRFMSPPLSAQMQSAAARKIMSKVTSKVRSRLRSKTHPSWVPVNICIRRKDRQPRTSLRCALEADPSVDPRTQLRGSGAAHHSPGAAVEAGGHAYHLREDSGAGANGAVQGLQQARTQQQGQEQGRGQAQEQGQEQENAPRTSPQYW